MEPYSRNIGRNAHGGQAAPQCNILVGKSISTSCDRLDFSSWRFNSNRYY